MLTLFQFYMNNFYTGKHNGKRWFYIPPCDKDTLKFSIFMDVYLLVAIFIIPKFL